MQPLYSAEKISERVASLAAQIDHDYAGRTVTAIAVLQGSFIFFADLVRALKTETRCEFLGVTAYAAAKRSRTGEEVKVVLDIEEALEGKDLLLVEDLVDSGATLSFLQRLLLARKPRSLKTCALLLRKANLRAEVKLDYVGFEIDEPYIVGYGIDHEGRHRELPYLGKLEQA